MERQFSLIITSLSLSVAALCWAGLYSCPRSLSQSKHPSSAPAATLQSLGAPGPFQNCNGFLLRLRSQLSSHHLARSGLSFLSLINSNLTKYWVSLDVTECAGCVRVTEWECCYVTGRESCHSVGWRPTDVPSWCQSEASVRPLHLTDNAECVERTGEIVSVCGVWPGVITRPAWCLECLLTALTSLTVWRGSCVLASDPGPLLSHSQPARTALAVWRPEEPLPPLRMRPGPLSLSLGAVWVCWGSGQLWGGGRTSRGIIGLQIRCDNYRHLHHLHHLHLLLSLPGDHLVHPEHMSPRLHDHCPIMSNSLDEVMGVTHYLRSYICLRSEMTNALKIRLFHLLHAS